MRRLSLCALALVAGCFGKFDPASFVNGLRVLAIKSEPPELAPGQTATLTPLVVDFNHYDGGVLPYTVDWALCNEAPIPGEEVGEDCVAADAGDSLTQLGSGPTMQVTMPQVTASQLGTPDSSGGVYLPVVLHVANGTDAITAVYRIRFTQIVSTPIYSGPLQPPNHNPKIDQIDIVYEDDLGTKLLEDGAFAINNGDRVTLKTVFAAGSAETYPTIEGTLDINNVVLDGGINFFDGGVQVGNVELVNTTEILNASWFTSIGSLSPDVTGDPQPNSTLTMDTKHTPEPPADIDLYVVARDERGGVDWTMRRLLLR